VARVVTTVADARDQLGWDIRERRMTEHAAAVGGWVAPGFEPVRVEFERNFSERGEKS